MYTIDDWTCLSLPERATNQIAGNSCGKIVNFNPPDLQTIRKLLMVSILYHCITKSLFIKPIYDKYNLLHIWYGGKQERKEWNNPTYCNEALGNMFLNNYGASIQPFT